MAVIANWFRGEVNIILLVNLGRCRQRLHDVRFVAGTFALLVCRERFFEEASVIILSYATLKKFGIADIGNPSLRSTWYLRSIA